MPSLILEPATVEQWIDEQVIERVVGGDTAAFEIIMRRYNQRLYRVARAILGDDHEARETEDVMRDTYLRLPAPGAIRRPGAVFDVVDPHCGAPGARPQAAAAACRGPGRCYRAPWRTYASLDQP
jgi:hypothetical protein